VREDPACGHGAFQSSDCRLGVVSSARAAGEAPPGGDSDVGEPRDTKRRSAVVCVGWLPDWLWKQKEE
jgi:hypothetical protein